MCCWTNEEMWKRSRVHEERDQGATAKNRANRLSSSAITIVMNDAAHYSPTVKTENEVDQLVDDDDFDDEQDQPGGANEVHDVALQPPTDQLLTTETLHFMIHEGLITLDAPYQRDIVWPDTKKISLIDSVFRNFYIPPVIFAVHKDSEGNETRVCVDGKQRLTSIQRFMDGSIPHIDTRSKKKYWFRSSPKETDKDVIPPEVMEEFQSKKIRVVEYHGIAPGMEREVFQRVQLGMPLTAAEKLQAIASPWAQWIWHLESKHISLENGLGEKLQWDTKRGREFQNLAHMVFCCEGLPEQHLPSPQKMEKWMSRLDEPAREFRDRVDDVLRCLWVLATEPRYNQAFTSKSITPRIAPVEFIFIGVLLYLLRQSSYEVKAKAVYQLRKGIRSQFKDIRNNSNVGKAMWRLVDKLLDNPEQLEDADEERHSTGRKRKKAASPPDDDDADEDYKARPAKSKGTGKPRGRPRKSQPA
ncbi:hypothetical protein CVT26_015878 [Gymnopilus dilepis]|uniref:GmrSD restriction endonucleases N-terminal domain-containing protein n=1 Tax=Gymnopilus dilepis TaxID=231916 RepID=A0A409XYA3_9AGAR|nr:hypothetical protein CVT26_015878 [Gymnopilus dilepis]